MSVRRLAPPEHAAEGVLLQQARTWPGPSSRSPNIRKAASARRSSRCCGGRRSRTAAGCRRRRSATSPTCSAWRISAGSRSRPSTRCSICSPVGKVHVQVCGTTPCRLRGADDLEHVCRKRIGDQRHVTGRRQVLLGRGRVPGRLRQCADGADRRRLLRGPDGGELRQDSRRFRRRQDAEARPADRPSAVRAGRRRHHAHRQIDLRGTFTGR